MVVREGVRDRRSFTADATVIAHHAAVVLRDHDPRVSRQVALEVVRAVLLTSWALDGHWWVFSSPFRWLATLEDPLDGFLD